MCDRAELLLQPVGCLLVKFWEDIPNEKRKRCLTKGTSGKFWWEGVAHGDMSPEGIHCEGGVSAQGGVPCCDGKSIMVMQGQMSSP